MHSILNICLDSLSTIATIATAVVAYQALQFTKKEYCLHKEREKAVTLSQYNERYTTDPNIQKVVNYLLWKSDSAPEDKNIDYGGRTEEELRPTKNQVELFMRFFEEVEVSIEAGRLDRDVVNDLFAYYAKELVKKGGNKKEEDAALNEYEHKEILPTDYDYKSNSWQYFNEFVNR